MQPKLSIYNIINLNETSINSANNNAEAAIIYEIINFLESIYAKLFYDHKRNKRIISVEVETARLEKILKRLKGANYNHLKKQIDAKACSIEERNYNTERFIISDVNQIVTDIAYIAEYSCLIYNDSYLTPTTENVFHGYNKSYKNGIFANFEIDDNFKLSIEAMFSLLMALNYFTVGNFRLSINRYADAQRIIRLPDINAFLSQFHSKRAAMGGEAKRKNYEDKKDKAIEYLEGDNKFSELKNNGRYKISNASAAREIVKYYDSIGQSLGYAENSLANIIRDHRK